MGEAKRRKQLSPNYGKPSLLTEFYKIVNGICLPKTEKMRLALKFQCKHFFCELLNSSADEICFFAIYFGKQPPFDPDGKTLDGITHQMSNPCFTCMTTVPLANLDTFLPPDKSSLISDFYKGMDLNCCRMGGLMQYDKQGFSLVMAHYALDTLEKELAEF